MRDALTDISRDIERIMLMEKVMVLRNTTS